jgi:hypothetical protein
MLFLHKEVPGHGPHGREHPGVFDRVPVVRSIRDLLLHHSFTEETKFGFGRGFGRRIEGQTERQQEGRKNVTPFEHGFSAALLPSFSSDCRILISP